MTNRLKILTILALLPVIGGISPAALGTDLIDIYQQALDNDPLLLEADATRRAAQESRPQAMAGLLPAINLQGQFDDQDTEGTTTSPAFTGGPVITTRRPSDADRLNWTLQLSQPLFRWDRWVALKRADKQVALEEANYAAAKQELGVRVAQRYFDVLAATDELKAEQANKEAIARQLEEAETRFEVGLIAITDVYESRSAYDQSVAAEIGAKRTLATALEILREITGSYASGELGAPGDDLPLVPPEPAAQEVWVTRALEQNLSVAAGRLSVDIAGDDIKTQRTGHYPTLDLVMSRNHFDSEGTRFDVTPIGGIFGGSSESDFDTDTIALQFSVPIYNGGGVRSRVRQAVHQQRAAKQRLERVARETERQTRDAFLGVEAEIARVRALAQAVASSETALEATEAGFDVGTRTSVDVLNSRRDLLRAQTNYRRARYDYLLNVVRLKQASGTLTLADLQDINQWLTH
ncbi:MAG: TolC family outer membrane protein [Gammaproteobacteria bacterium]